MFLHGFSCPTYRNLHVPAIPNATENFVQKAVKLSRLFSFLILNHLFYCQKGHRGRKKKSQRWSPVPQQQTVLSASLITPARMPWDTDWPSQSSQWCKRHLTKLRIKPLSITLRFPGCVSTAGPLRFGAYISHAEEL